MHFVHREIEYTATDLEKDVENEQLICNTMSEMQFNI